MIISDSHEFGGTPGHPWIPTPPPQKITSPSSIGPSHYRQGLTDCPRVTLVELQTPPSWLSPHGGPQATPIVDHCQGPRYPESVLAGTHHLGGITGERLGLHLFTMGRCLGARGVTAPGSNVVPYLHSNGGHIWNLTGSPCQTLAKEKQHKVTITLELDLNARIILVSESCSTPFGCLWPNPRHCLIHIFLSR